MKFYSHNRQTKIIFCTFAAYANLNTLFNSSRTIPPVEPPRLFGLLQHRPMRQYWKRAQGDCRPIVEKGAFYAHDMQTRGLEGGRSRCTPARRTFARTTCFANLGNRSPADTSAIDPPGRKPCRTCICIRLVIFRDKGSSTALCRIFLFSILTF